MLDFIQTMVKFVGFMMLIVTGITLFEEKDYILAIESFSIFLVSLVISYLLSNLIEKKAYDIHQKAYGIVLVSDKIFEDCEEMGETEFEMFFHPFGQEAVLNYETGNVGFFYQYSLKEWKDKSREEGNPVEQDPTFFVVTANKNAELIKSMKNPFLVSSKPAEVVQFLEGHRW